MTDILNDPLSRAILEYLYELTRTQRGTHHHETIGGGIAVHIGKRVGAPKEDIAVALEQLVGAGLVRERQQLRLLSSGRSIDSWVYGITGSGIVELKGESRIGSAKDRPVEVLPTATDLRESYFNNVEVRLLDFVRRGFRISGRTFDGCLISGPAVIDLHRTHLDERCVFFVPENGDATVFVEPGRTLAGIVLVEDCIFHNCRFRNVGVVARVAQDRQLTAIQSANT
jgi:hypothetical protein